MIIPWYIPLFLSSFLLGFLNYYLKGLCIFELLSFLKMSICCIVISYGFWYGYKYSPSFIYCFLLALSGTSLSTIFVSLFLLKEQFNIFMIIGILFVILGNIIVVKSFN